MTNDDVPWADPAIQAEYEAALGQFLVSFNAVENSLGEILDLAIEKSRRPDLRKRLRFKGYGDKVRGLAFLALAHPQWIDAALLVELDELGDERNALAHGHFDENPFDGSYVIRSGRRHPLTKTRDDLMRATEWAERVRHRVRTLIAQLTFDDVSDDEGEEVGSPSGDG